MAAEPQWRAGINPRRIREYCGLTATWESRNGGRGLIPAGYIDAWRRMLEAIEAAMEGGD